MITTLRKRIESEKGFTLIEMLIVIIILGILLAIAVPAYLNFRDRANRGAAQANIRAAIPAIEAYNADNNGYLNMVIGPSATDSYSLQETYDAAIKAAPALTVLSKTATTYCVRGTSGSFNYYKTQATDISTTACT